MRVGEGIAFGQRAINAGKVLGILLHDIQFDLVKHMTDALRASDAALARLKQLSVEELVQSDQTVHVDANAFAVLVVEQLGQRLQKVVHKRVEAVYKILFRVQYLAYDKVSLQRLMIRACRLLLDNGLVNAVVTVIAGLVELIAKQERLISVVGLGRLKLRGQYVVINVVVVCRIGC